MLAERLKELKAKKPLIHCITNPVTINDCANVLLSCGASPIMAQWEEEAAEVAARADGVVINLGVPDAPRLRASFLAAERARMESVPVVLDPVGVGTSPKRLEAARRLLDSGAVTLIRGNLSEIQALAGGRSGERGVDTAGQLELSERMELAQGLSRATGAAVLLTGAADVAAWKGQARVLEGGDPWMGRITGCGCMLSSLCGAFLGSGASPFEAAVCGGALMALSGAKAAAHARGLGLGTGSMRAFLVDQCGLITPEELEQEGRCPR